MGTEANPFFGGTPEARMAMLRPSIRAFAYQHKDPALRQFYADLDSVLDISDNPMTEAVQQIVAVPLPSRPVDLANKLPRQLLSQVVFKAVGSDIDRAAALTPQLLKGRDKRGGWLDMFDILSEEGQRASYLGGVIVPTQTNVPSRGSAAKAIALVHGIKTPSMAELGSSAGLIPKQQMLGVPYEDVGVGIWDEFAHDYNPDPELTEDFNRLVHYPDFKPRRVACIDLFPPLRDLDQIRMLVFSMYPSEWQDQAYVDKMVDLIKAPAPPGLTYLDEDATDFDFDRYREFNPDLAEEGADITTAPTMLNQCGDQEKQRRVIATMRRLTKLGGLMIVQDFGSFERPELPDGTLGMHRTEFKAREGDWPPFSYSLWVAHNDHPEANPPIDDFQLYGRCLSGRVEAVAPTDYFTSLVMRSEIVCAA